MNEQLIQRIYDYVEQGEVDKAVRASLRLSRQIGDHMNTALFLRELIDDKQEIARVIYDDTSHLKEEAQKYLFTHSFDRWLKSRTLPYTENNGEDSKNVLVISVGEFPEELRQCEKSISDMVVPSTMGEYDSAAFTDRYDRIKSQLRLRIKSINAIKDRILNKCLNFAIGIERQLLSQAKSMQFLEQAQNEVQNYFKDRSEDVYDKLQKANQLINSSSAEDLSLLLTQIRRSLKSVADYFMPAESSPRVCADGITRTLGDEQYINRLHEFVYTTFPRSTSTELVRAELEYLLVFAKKLNDISSKGVHASVTEAEAKQGFLGIYLFLFNIINKINGTRS